MRIGMLWFDNSDERDLTTRLERAIEYYEAKYGERPTTCYMHPSTLFGNPTHLAGIEVRTSNTILPNHFWLGVEEEEMEERTAA